MSKRYWVAAAALGLIVSVQNPAWSQESAVDQEPQAQGQTHDNDEAAAPPGIPIRILEEPEQPERDRRRQKEADQREIEDLLAQESMAKSTEEIVLWTRLQFALALSGTAALVYSLHLNRKATKAAVDAVRMERAWMLWSSSDYGGFERGMTPMGPVNDGIFFKIGFTNSGRSPAIGVRAYTEFRVIELDAKVPEFSPTMDYKNAVANVAPNEGITLPVLTNDADTSRLRKREGVLVIFVCLEYFDIFQDRSKDKPRHTSACIIAEHGGGTIKTQGSVKEVINFSATGEQNAAT